MAPAESDGVGAKSGLVGQSGRAAPRQNVSGPGHKRSRRGGPTVALAELQPGRCSACGNLHANGDVCAFAGMSRVQAPSGFPGWDRGASTDISPPGVEEMARNQADHAAPDVVVSGTVDAVSGSTLACWWVRVRVNPPAPTTRRRSWW